jgi:hypothetical protein
LFFPCPCDKAPVNGGILERLGVLETQNIIVIVTRQALVTALLMINLRRVHSHSHLRTRLLRNFPAQAVVIPSFPSFNNDPR